MVNSYIGHFLYSALSVGANAPLAIGVYYCGQLNLRNELVPLYIGKSVSLRERLQSHISAGDLRGISHFGYIRCSTQQEAEVLEAAEIRKHQPKYNEQGKKVFR